MLSNSFLSCFFVFGKSDRNIVVYVDDHLSLASIWSICSPLTPFFPHHALYSFACLFWFPFQNVVGLHRYQTCTFTAARIFFIIRKGPVSKWTRQQWRYRQSFSRRQLWLRRLRGPQRVIIDATGAEANRRRQLSHECSYGPTAFRRYVQWRVQH